MNEQELDRLLLESQNNQPVSESDLDALLLGNAGGQIVEEMHPDVSKVDRALIKNFGNDDQASVGFLKQKYPGMDIQTRDGRILMKQPGERDFKVLDPDTGFLSMDMLNDASDIVYDVGAGVGEGAAFAAGLPAAGVGGLATGAAAGVGLETLRQGIGKYLGVNDEVQMDDIAMAGAGGAIPVVAGGLSRGAYKALKKAAPSVGSYFTGVSKKTLQNLPKHMDTLDDITNAGQATQFIDDTVQGVSGTIKGTKQAYGKQLENLAADAPGTGSIRPTLAMVDDKIDELKRLSDSGEVPSAIDEIDALEELKREIFSNRKVLDNGVEEFTSIPEDVGGTALHKLKQSLAERAKFSNKAIDVPSPRKAIANKTVERTAKEAVGLVDESLGNLVGEAWKLGNSKYKEVLQLQKEIAPFFKDSYSAVRAMRGLSRKDKDILYRNIQKLDEYANQLGKPINLEDRIKQFEIYSVFKNPDITPLMHQQSGNPPASALMGTLGALGGYKMGAGYTGAALGGSLGSLIGNFVGAPGLALKATKLAPTLNKASSWGGPKSYGALKSIWDMSTDKHRRSR